MAKKKPFPFMKFVELLAFAYAWHLLSDSWFSMWQAGKLPGSFPLFQLFLTEGGSATEHGMRIDMRIVLGIALLGLYAFKQRFDRRQEARRRVDAED